jgi:hypothetical protein
VRRELKRRLSAAELSGSGGIEIWIFQGDGTVRGPHGEQMMREEAEAPSPDYARGLADVAQDVDSV